MSNFKNIPICYQHKCRVPDTWEKIGLKKCNTIKECEDFCNNMKVILTSMKDYWRDEFDEELFDSMLSPHELLKTYIYCKAKSFYTKL